VKSVFEKIQSLEIPSYSKHEQLVQGVIDAINDKNLIRGDMLPSVNTMSQELGFARETIVKAYRTLKDRGIIASKNRLGYYVVNEDTEQTLKVALMMFGFDTFQEIFYRNFREGVGEKVHVDVFFHHNNMDVFETMLHHIQGKYGMYVISPIPHPNTKGLLEQIPRTKFLMFDRYEGMDGTFNHITQEFEASSYRIFTELWSTLRQFDEFILIYEHHYITPTGILTAFQKFGKTYQLQTTIQQTYQAGTLQKGKVYFTLENTYLYQMIKDAKAQGLKLGQDVGILSHNDEPLKEILADGITTYSTDFGLIGRKAAHFVLTREPLQEVVPTVLIRRNSL
jgi:DNA-binding transcriptional regulator YhcF (GntR family)